jgi:hypothetical protein
VQVYVGVFCSHKFWLRHTILQVHQSTMIEAKLTCRCGAIQGKICAKQEDAIRLHCYCNDCRAYANFIAAKEQGAENSKPMVNSSAESRLVLVGKNAVTIDQGIENFKLARKAANKGLFRYYAGCCHVQLMNTGDTLGFVGVNDAILNEKKDEFDGPWGFCKNEAAGLPIINHVPTLSGARFAEHLERHAPWIKSGPFDYSFLQSTGAKKRKNQTEGYVFRKISDSNIPIHYPIIQPSFIFNRRKQSS